MNQTCESNFLSNVFTPLLTRRFVIFDYRFTLHLQRSLRVGVARIRAPPAIQTWLSGALRLRSNRTSPSEHGEQRGNRQILDAQERMACRSAKLAVEIYPSRISMRVLWSCKHRRACWHVSTWAYCLRIWFIGGGLRTSEQVWSHQIEHTQSKG